MANSNITLQVSEMSCAACEQRIESALSKMTGIVNTNASYSSGMVSITFDGSVTNVSKIKEALKHIGYPAREGEKPHAQVKQWIASVLALIAIIAGYVVLDQNNVFYMFPIADQSTSLPMLFVIGLLTSVHCIAMCGGINISQCAHAKTGDPINRYKRLMPSLLYNAGRVVSYTIIGGIVGAIGTVIAPSGSFKGIVAIAASAFMLIMGLNMLGLFPFLHRLIPRMPKVFAKKVGAQKVGRAPFVVGLLNGFMPCGPLQAMQLYALSSGSFLKGALAMGLFSLGTVPLMFALGALSSILSARFTHVMLRISAVLVILLGLMMLNNGLSLSGFTPIF